MHYLAEHDRDNGRRGRNGYSGRAAATLAGRSEHSSQERDMDVRTQIRRNVLEPANSDRPVRPVRSLAFSLLFTVSAALGGAALPFTFGEMFPRSFTATAVVGVERNETVDAMAARLKNNETFDRLAETLDLRREPALAGRATGPLAVATDLLTGAETTSAPPATALRRSLAETLSLMPDRDAGQLSLAVTTADPLLSVRLANAFAGQGVEQAAASALDAAHGLTAARKAAEEAEKELADFSAVPDDTNLDEASRLAADLEARDADITAREETLATLKVESARIAALKITDMAAGLADAGFDVPVFDDARQKYTAAKLELDQLATELGPRHPRLVAARSATDEARVRLQDALRKLDTVYKDRLKAAMRGLDDAKAARAKLDAGSTDVKNHFTTLETLKQDADRLRADYLDKVDISRAAPAPVTARVMSLARPDTVIANGASPAFVAMAGAGMGILLAFAWLYLTGRARVDADEEEATDTDEHTAGEWRRDVEPHRGRDGDGWRADDVWGPPSAENDDEPLAERLRALLRRSAEMDFRETMRSNSPDRQSELEEIRRRMMSLRHRVQEYNARRDGERY